MARFAEEVDVNGNPSRLSVSHQVLAWSVVLLELIAPVPAVLTFGAVFVLLARPPAFLRLVERLYGRDV